MTGAVRRNRTRAGAAMQVALALAIGLATLGCGVTMGPRVAAPGPRPMAAPGAAPPPPPAPAPTDGWARPVPAQAVAYDRPAPTQRSVPARQPATRREGSVVVLPLVPKRTDAATVEILTDILVNAVANVSGYGVIAPADLDAMLGAERMKEALGCDSVSCYADIGGALNAQFLVSGSVSRLGSRSIVTLSMVDTKGQKVLSRGRAETENNEDLYMAAIEQAVSDLITQAPN